jgi:Phosphoesterase family
LRTPLISFLFLTVILVSGTLANTTLSVNNSVYIPLKVGRWFDYVVVIMMENHSINNTYGISVLPNSWNSNSQTCLGNCTFYDSLANSNGLAEEYTVDGITGCSLGCYIAITSGYGNTLQACNNGPFASGCQLLQLPNIVDRLESAHLSWKAYMEDYPTPSGCNNDFTGNYEPNHNPFIYYADIQNNATRCSHIVLANSQPASQSTCWPTTLPIDNVLINDLNSPSSASNYTFLTPNRIDDNHDCNDVSVGNAWLSNLIPQILGSTVFKTKRAALFVTFDEQGCTFSGCPSSIPELYSVWASSSAKPTTKAGFKSVNPYTHYNPLRTIEDNWNLPALDAKTDGSAQNMHEFFLP